MVSSSISRKLRGALLAGTFLALPGFMPFVLSDATADTVPVATVKEKNDEANTIATAGGTTSSSTASKSVPVTPTDFPPLQDVLKDYTQVVSTSDGIPGFYKIWKRDKDQQLIAELPKDFEKQKHFIALTVASGDSYAGLQSGEIYGYWRRYDKKLAFIEPNLDIRSSGDDASKNSVKRLFTDRVLFEVPILSYNLPNGGPLIDLDALLVGQAEKFFGARVSGINKSLYKIHTAKSFPKNVELGIEVPVENGRLRTIHYSISHMPDDTGYKPREADLRIGYFTTSYTDFGKFTPNDVDRRFINRWHLEKADPSLKLSPPKNPIVFYVEHTTPVRYRRWVQQGLLAWNKAFEKVGLINVIEVRFQDAVTGEHMEKDPEDVRYNFVRWLSNGVGTAIGPSRVHPLTGQILDADIILTDGWIRHWWQQFNEVIPNIAMEGLSPEAMSWMWENPQWDPRVRLASPSKRAELISARANQPIPAMGGHPLAESLMNGTQDAHDHRFIGDSNEYEGLTGLLRQRNGLCMAPNCKSEGLAQMALSLEIEDPVALGLNENDQNLDGIPESFIGPLLVDLVAHEAGHTLGLRHNFKASTVYTYEQINSDEIKGKKPFAGSVMDYIPVNIVAGDDPAKKGDFGMIEVGPYDEWAIEYGYTFESDLKPILARVAEPELVYATDEDTVGPDPTATRHDFAKNPLSYAQNQVALANQHRAQILDKFVKEGDSWGKARRGYLLTLSVQSRAVNIMANWLGGVHIHRDHKGDPNGRRPIEPVSAGEQRSALAFCLENTFRDSAYGITPELLAHMSKDNWMDKRNADTDRDDLAWPVHDRILSLQATVLTRILNPVTLGRVYDNEARVAADQDFITLPEVLETVKNEIWTELGAWNEGQAYDNRKPFISSFRRNLQREYVDRLIDLATNAKLTKSNPSYKAISDLASLQLEEIKGSVDGILGKQGLDTYSRSHLSQTSKRIERALNAQLTVQAN